MSALEDLFDGVLRGAGIPFKREYRFHPPRRWKFDFQIGELTDKIAVEIEGGTWVGGAHVRGDKYRKDCEKYNQAVVDGWRVFRFSDKRDFADFPDMYQTLIRKEG